jgi:putative transposase
MSREAHVRFWEGVGVKLPRATHFVVLNDAHLHRLLRTYLTYYHGCRTHLSLEKDAPEPRPVEHPDQGGIVEIPMVGGLHHRYTRQAA